MAQMNLQGINVFEGSDVESGNLTVGEALQPTKAEYDVILAKLDVLNAEIERMKTRMDQNELRARRLDRAMKFCLGRVKNMTKLVNSLNGIVCSTSKTILAIANSIVDSLK